MFPALIVVAFVPGVIDPLLDASTVLEIIPPLSVIHRTILMLVNAEPVRLVISPRAFIHVAVHVHKFAFAVRLVFMPVPDVLRTILPLLHAIAITEPAFPFA